MKILKESIDNFIIFRVTPDELERLMYISQSVKCHECVNQYKCESDGKCANLSKIFSDAVIKHWIDTAETEAEKECLRIRFYGEKEHE